jgi:hypothetical protein|nr:MAG TPA: hypothetical protein [Bacteriophage sp.]
MLDYKQTDKGDLDLSTGDLLVAESTYQHQRDLLYSDKGHIRQKAEAGVGAVNYMMDNDPEGLLRATRKEFTADGMKVTKVVFAAYSNDLNVEARYEND